MKNLSFILSAIFAVSIANAAKFQTNRDGFVNEELSLFDFTVRAALFDRSKADLMGDCSDYRTYNFERKASETDTNTMKQLGYAKAGLLPGDEESLIEVIGENRSQYAITDLFSILDEIDREDNEEEVYQEQREFLLNELVLEDPTLKIYSAIHGYEDGSWGILGVLDSVNQQILLVRLGFCGT